MLLADDVDFCKNLSCSETNMAVEQFLAMLRFEGRSKLAELLGPPVRDRDGTYFPPE